MTRESIGCLECGGEMMAQAQSVPYGDGLEVVLEGVEVRRCPDCGEEEVVVPRVEQLHRSIAEALARRPGAFSPPEVRFLRSWLGHSSSDFARLMGVSAETVSRWESRRVAQRMGAAAERLLRILVLTGRPISSYGLERAFTSDDAAPAALRVSEGGGGWSVITAE